MLAHLHAPSLKLGPDSPLLSLDSCQVPENILGETPSGQQLLVDVLLKLAPGVRGKIIATAQNTLKFLQGAIV
jgi:hypothetical protein